MEIIQNILTPETSVTILSVLIIVIGFLIRLMGLKTETLLTILKEIESGKQSVSIVELKQRIANDLDYKGITPIIDTALASLPKEHKSNKWKNVFRILFRVILPKIIFRR
jgi:hypothetical protein